MFALKNTWFYNSYLLRILYVKKWFTFQQFISKFIDCSKMSSHVHSLDGKVVDIQKLRQLNTYIWMEIEFVIFLQHKTFVDGLTKMIITWNIVVMHPNTMIKHLEQIECDTIHLAAKVVLQLNWLEFSALS